MKEYVIAIKDNKHDVVKKITKIVAYKSGGFAVLMPYHKANEGFLMKLPIDYSVPSGESSQVPFSDIIKYSANDRVKLSFHPDGFVQFSGENKGKIISGRDKHTGEIKGLGILSAPFRKPVQTGPSFAIMAWGIEDFEDVQPKDIKRCVTLEEGDMYYRGCNPKTCNSYLIEVFIFPKIYWSAIRVINNQYKMTLTFPNYEAHWTVLEFRILPLEYNDILLGVMISRLKYSQTPKFKSGFHLSGPSDLKQGESKAHGLYAMYPDLKKVAKDVSLNYET